MKFNIQVYQLEHYLSKAATVLGSGQSTASMQGFCFSSHDGHVTVWCTDGDSFAEVETTVPIEADVEGFVLSARKLSSLVAYLNPKDDISFELLDSSSVKIVSGSYSGEWTTLEKKNFPDLPQRDIGMPTKLNTRNFCKSVEAVKYAAEGLMGAERRIVFRRGFCWGASSVRLQLVESGLDERVDIVIPFAALGVVKFLEKSIQTDEDEFDYAESDTYVSFYTGRDIFSCLKAIDSEQDEEKDFTERLKPSKHLWFEIEVEELHNAVVRASLTCEMKSAEIRFEFDEKVLYVIGADKFENQGIDKLIVSPQGDLKQLGGVKVAGWAWILAALHAVKAKAVRITFDDNYMIISYEGGKGILSLVSSHNVKRLTAAK